jgi:hypothetical protein
MDVLIIGDITLEQKFKVHLIFCMLLFSLIFVLAAIPLGVNGNTSPEITGFTPEETQITITESDSAAFSATAVDADGDVLTYKWELTNLNTKASSIVSTQHTFTYATDYNSAGVYILNLTVEDITSNSSQAYQEWDITVNENNRPPTINVLEPLDPRPIIKTDMSLKFRVSYEDSDIGDEMTIVWLIDGENASSGLETYEYYPQSYGMGYHIVTAKVSDGKDESTYTWNVTVKENGRAVDNSGGLTWDDWAKIENVILIVLFISPVIAVIVIVIIFQRKKHRE